MKLRDVEIYTGQRYEVPQGIQRIDSRSTHGWQLRYGGTKFYSDSKFSADPGEALKAATKELAKRIAKLPAPTRLKPGPNGNKTSELPVGISGPIVRQRRANVRDCSFTVLLPRFGEAPRRRSVYIASESTYTVERYYQALEKAVELRQEAEEAYRRAATRAKRAEMKTWLAEQA
ncbi:hypothetical protein RQP53_05315 [Paucibacter sp. APW11]|uniref:AP2 domain-containing protein n=1 Tax=Roseateles aquae TaxID=3077235 RepID=A0ABU3P7Y4_9BURK|nr:hypothetical protein [Paucibacter sp. APW11]MDT8998686.1 hypothetical protein [Paucibacter sp. APW11]